MMFKRILATTISITLLITSLVFGAEPDLEKNLIYSIQPTLDYDQVVNLGNGYFAGRYLENQKNIGKNIKSIYLFDSTGKNLGTFECQKLEQVQKGIFAAYVNKNGKTVCGLVDENGKTIIGFDYTSIHPFSEGLARVEKDIAGSQKQGFIYPVGTIAIPIMYEDARDFKEGLAAVKTQGKWGFIDSTGKEIIKPQFDTAESFDDGVTKVTKEGKVGYIDKKGKAFVKIKNYIYGSNFNQGNAIVLQDYEKNELFLLDKKGKSIKTIYYPGNIFFSPKNNGYFYTVNDVINKEGVWEQKTEYYNNMGEKVSFLKYEAGDNLSEGLSAAHNDQKLGYVNKTGRTIIPFAFDYANDFKDGYAVVKVDGKYGVIKSPLNSITLVESKDI